MSAKELKAHPLGGREKNKHSDKRLHAGRGTVGKAVVAGVKDRETKEVRAEVVQGTDRDTLQGFIEAHVEQDARKFTDEHHAYHGLCGETKYISFPTGGT